MSAQTALQIYREESLEAAIAGDARDQRAISKSTPVLAVLISAAVHLAVLAGATIAGVLAISNGVSTWRAIPNQPLHTVFVALVLAQCGTGAVVLAHTKWSLYIKLLAAVALVGGLWLLLLAVMETTTDQIAAAAWAISLGTQTIIAWLGATLIDFCVAYRSTVIATRFHLLHLMLGTTIIAVLLGGSRVVAERSGFALADVPQWGFFEQVEAAACTSALIAIGIYATLQWRVSLARSLMLAGPVLAVIVFAVPLLFVAAFGQEVGASLVEMRWLFGSEGLFLLATLAPMQMLRDDYYIVK